MTKQRKIATQNDEKMPPATQKDEILTLKDKTTPAKKRDLRRYFVAKRRKDETAQITQHGTNQPP